MPITYNLKYKKINYLGRPVLEKEGEIVIEQNAFRLKGKGANDQGELIQFTDVKEMFVKKDMVIFSTIAKEKYYLSHFKNLMNDFVNDFVEKRNKVLLDALFLQKGELKKEYEAYFEYNSKFDRTICKGMGNIQLYDKSIVVIPEIREAFSIPFDFIANQDTDEINYEIILSLDNGKKIAFSQLNTSYDDFLEKLDKLREEMYQNIVNGLRNHLPEFSAVTVLKLASLMKGGKATPISSIKKIDPELWDKFSEILFPTKETQESLAYFLEMVDEKNIYVGFHDRPNAGEGEKNYYAWLLASIPEKNVIAVQLMSHPQLNTHFFQIIMEQGIASEKDKERIHEINQTMLRFNFDTQVFSRDRRDLRRTKYRLVLSKIPFIRSLRKSYLGRAYFKTKEDWLKYVELYLKKGSLVK